MEKKLKVFYDGDKLEDFANKDDIEIIDVRLAQAGEWRHNRPQNLCTYILVYRMKKSLSNEKN